MGMYGASLAPFVIITHTHAHTVYAYQYVTSQQSKSVVTRTHYFNRVNEGSHVHSFSSCVLRVKEGSVH